MMKIIFSKNAWEDYLSWQKEDKKILKRVNQLIKDIQRTPYHGIGNPEPLKYDLAGFWSRRIDREHRLVYKVTDQVILIFCCKYNYDKLGTLGALKSNRYMKFCRSRKPKDYVSLIYRWRR